ncbi:c-type cytochrome [Sphingomonas sp. CJ99]
MKVKAITLAAAIAGGAAVVALTGGHAAPVQKAASPGAVAFAQCKACHSLAKGGPNGVGPNLHGVVGRKAASVAGYKYSPALAKSGVVWTEEKLDAYLTNPAGLVPGTKMVTRVNDPAKRAALIAYLKAEGSK